MRQVLVALALVTVGCGPEFSVLPRNGQERIQAQAPMGITVTAHAEQWRGDPYDLADWFTPILVELYNPGPYEVRVSLADFALRDEHGSRYAAINPFLPSLLGENDPGDTGVMLAARGGGFSFRGGGGFRSSYRGGGVRVGTYGGVVIGAPTGRRIYGGGWYGWGGGFRLSPGLRGWYGWGPGIFYWDYPFIRPPYYADWVYWWGPSYCPWPRPSQDVLSLALPEGVLPPNTRVQGFLYFRRATGGGQANLDLGWELVDARTSQNLGSLHVPLAVVHN
jgi:hypothetical protein